MSLSPITEAAARYRLRRAKILDDAAEAAQAIRQDYGLPRDRRQWDDHPALYNRLNSEVRGSRSGLREVGLRMPSDRAPMVAAAIATARIFVVKAPGPAAEEPSSASPPGGTRQPPTDPSELDAPLLSGGGEPSRVLEDLHHLGGRQQEDRPAPAGALGVGGQHLHAVAGPQAPGHVSRVDLDRQLHQVGVPTGGEDETGRDERLAPDRRGQDPACDPAAGAGSQVVA
ncbi:MAG: hypothetical protein ACJ75M_03545 [Actinomycetes bacterium]